MNFARLSYLFAAAEVYLRLLGELSVRFILSGIKKANRAIAGHTLNSRHWLSKRNSWLRIHKNCVWTSVGGVEIRHYDVMLWSTSLIVWASWNCERLDCVSGLFLKIIKIYFAAFVYFKNATCCIVYPIFKLLLCC